MKKYIRLFFSLLIFVLFPHLASAALRPVAVLSAGADILSTHNHQYITLIAPFQNEYVGSHQSVDFVGGLFLGFEKSLSEKLSAQLGVSYYQNAGWQSSGMIYQFSDPNMGNLNYQYNIVSRRVLLETKILGTFQKAYHPFVSLGVGEAFNTAQQYDETPASSTGVPMSPGFADRTTHSLAYFLGFGLEKDMSQHIRLGALYRYAYSGRSELGMIPGQDSNQTLKNRLFYASEILLQLTYLG